jgi:hypothetical protein
MLNNGAVFDHKRGSDISFDHESNTKMKGDDNQLIGDLIIENPIKRDKS